ncbi:hypothetical protein NKG94_08025 [Micromonospora sp. M12]
MRKVTVLGSCGAFPEPGRACSGFAVDWDGYRLVLDLVTPRCRGCSRTGRMAWWTLSSSPMSTRITASTCTVCSGCGSTVSPGPRLPLYCPPGVLDRLSGLEPDVDLHAVFDLHPLPGSYRVGPFDLTGLPLRTSCPTPASGFRPMGSRWPTRGHGPDSRVGRPGP